MNERIKNLVKQTARELVYEHDDDIGGVMDVWKFQDKDIEKFAELIVKECANVANTGIDPAESHLPGDDILEHFGVEE